MPLSKLTSFLALSVLGGIQRKPQKEYAGKDARGVPDGRRGTIVAPRRLKRNAPCFCKSGKKFKHCHGRPQ